VVVGQGSTINIDMWLVTKSVLIFLGIPLVLGWLTRLVLRRWKGDEWYERWFIRIVGPVSLMGLLFTILVMFALQGNRIVDNIGSVLRLIVPLVLYFGITFGGTLFVCYRLGLSYKLSVTQSFTASSNNFELAIAVAIATYGIDSFEALATVIGPLIEVPVLLGFVYVMRWAAHYWESPPEPLPLEEGVVELHAKE
jgi:ACR3 family arsenite transporter